MRARVYEAERDEGRREFGSGDDDASGTRSRASGLDARDSRGEKGVMEEVGLKLGKQLRRRGVGGR